MQPPSAKFREEIKTEILPCMQPTFHNATMSGARLTLFASLFASRACAFTLCASQFCETGARAALCSAAALMAGRQPLYKLLANEAAS
jgi:hypothetical protein